MEFRVVKRVTFDWFYDTNNGEQYSTYFVDGTGVEKILYHSPAGDGDRHFCDIIFSDGTVCREFNLNSVVFL